jgi:hypothetical protein
MSTEESRGPKAKRIEVAKTLAETLGETEPSVCAQLSMIVKKLGPDQALSFLQETLDIEEKGGMMLPDGSRRRTKGGVFFHLVRTKGPEELRYPWRKKKTAEATEAGAQEAGVKPMPAVRVAWTLEDHRAALQESGEEKGRATTVKLTIIGRPGKVLERGTYVITVIQSSSVPSFPKGLPTLSTAATTYVLYIAAKQWKQVAEAIQDTEDALIVEGFPAQVDAKTGSLAVFALSATTKKLQQAKRHPQAKSEKA